MCGRRVRRAVGVPGHGRGRFPSRWRSWPCRRSRCDTPTRGNARPARWRSGARYAKAQGRYCGATHDRWRVSNEMKPATTRAPTARQRTRFSSPAAPNCVSCVARWRRPTPATTASWTGAGVGVARNVRGVSSGVVRVPAWMRCAQLDCA